MANSGIRQETVLVLRQRRWAGVSPGRTLWDHWHDGSTIPDSCTILVGPPDPAVTGIHDRSPVLLGDAAMSLWISPALKPEDVSRVLALPNDTLTAQPVSRVADDGLYLLTA